MNCSRNKQWKNIELETERIESKMTRVEWMIAISIFLGLVKLGLDLYRG